jgi:signal transduction histidine kinase
MAPGSGLGLYVARKIALARGGRLELDGERAPADGAAFCLLLPVPESERHERTTDVAAAV